MLCFFSARGGKNRRFPARKKTGVQRTPVSVFKELRKGLPAP